MDDRAPLYCLALLGNIPEGFAAAIREALIARLLDLELEVGRDVSLFEGNPSDFLLQLSIDRCCAALCFEIGADQEAAVEKLIKRRIPLIPVATSLATFPAEFPGKLGALNGMEMGTNRNALAVALLEAASLVPKQRRVFLSYRRTESTEVALQLYAALSARQYDVFLDTHKILKGEHFQDALWQRLCDSDVLVYLDTPGYFESRWTTQEFAKASLRGLCVLRVGWPDVVSKVQQTVCGEINLPQEALKPGGGLREVELAQIIDKVELLRTKSVAQRYSRLIGKLRTSIDECNGEILGYSARRSVILSVGGKRIVAYPEMGVPTTFALHEATLDAHQPPVAVVYNQVGIKEHGWRAHMDWFGGHVTGFVRLVSTDDAGWAFLEWP